MDLEEEQINYEKKDIIIIVNYLLKKYQNNDFISEDSIMKEIIRELLETIFLDYKKSFCLNELYKNGYQYLLYINDSEHNFMRSIDLIDSFTPNKNNKKMRLITLFSFLQNIRDEIEIKTEENNSSNIIKEINFLKPEFFALPEFCIYYFENQIDYTERETKIMSIYNFIECLIYEIQLNKKN